MKRIISIFISVLMVLSLIPAFTLAASEQNTRDVYTREDAAVFLADKFALADIHASDIEGTETTVKDLGYTASSGAIVTKNVIAAAKDCVELATAPKIEAVINAQLLGLAEDNLSFNPTEAITVRELATAVAKGMFGADLEIDHLQKAIDAGLIDAQSITDEPITDEQVATLFAFLDDIQIVAVFATADIHGNYIPYTSSDAAFSIGSVARIKTIMDEVTAVVGEQNVLYVDGGDSPYNTTLANVTLGRCSVAALGALGLDATVLGNHDFDYSFQNLLELRDLAEYEMLSANVKFKEGMEYEGEQQYPFNDYIVKQVGGLTFGIFGVTDDNSAATTLYSNTVDIEFDDDLTTATALVNTLKTTENCDVIIALSHVHSKNSQLVRDNADVDISIGGGNDIAGRPTIVNDDQYLINPGKHAEALNQINVIIYGGEMTGIVYNQIFLTDAYAEDAEIKALIDDYNSQVDEAMDLVVGYNAQNLPWSTELVRLQNSPIANLCTTALLDYFADYEPDVCFVNGGGMRAGIDEGPVTLRQINAVLPFDNNMMLVETSGASIVAALENGSKSLPETNGSFLQPAGLTYKVNYARPVGSRIEEVRMSDGELIDLNARYKVVINSFLAGGGDGYTMFNLLDTTKPLATDCEQIVYVNQTYMRHALQQYFEKSTEANPIVVDLDEVRIDVYSEGMTFAYFTTTDMHGRAAEMDVSTGANDANSMVRVSTLLKAQKALYGANTLIVDNGDTYQGNLLAQYAATMNNTVENPMTIAMKAIGYDAFVLGNHEFNYLPSVRDTQMKMLQEAGIDVLAANVTLIEDGKNMLGEDVSAGDPFYGAYTIKEFVANDGNKVRVAVIGFENAACDTWDSVQNFPNLQFHSADNTERLFENEINKWTSYISQNEDVDIIIVSAHTGAGSQNSTSLESQGIRAAANTTGVALMGLGHDHSARITNVTNPDGEPVYVINGGGSYVAKAEFHVTFDEEGNVADYTIKAENLPIGTATVDTALQEKMQPWYNEARAWAEQPRGTFTGGWDLPYIKAESQNKSNNDMVTAQSHLLDLVHKAQIWATWQSYESKGIEGATVSIGSAVFAYDRATGYISFVPSDGDTVSLLDVSRLYRYSNNLLTSVDMTGEQLWNWMNTVADMYNYNANNGRITLNSSIYGVDTFYGVDYEIDLSREKGSRLVYAKYNGEDLKTYDGLIRCAINSYRIGGGYGFFEATGLDGDDCCWTASQYLGDQRAPVPTLICEYIEAMETVTPFDEPMAGTESRWSLMPSSLFGDANESGGVDAADAAYILRYVVRLVNDRDINKYLADADDDKVISAADAAKILRWVVRLETSLGPVEKPAA